MGKQSARPGPLTCTPAWQGEGRVAACSHLLQLLPEGGKSGRDDHPIAFPPVAELPAAARATAAAEEACLGVEGSLVTLGLRSLGRRKECAVTLAGSSHAVRAPGGAGGVSAHLTWPLC